MEVVDIIVVILFVLLLLIAAYFIFKNKSCDYKKINNLNIFGKKTEPERDNYQNWDGNNDEKTFIL